MWDAINDGRSRPSHAAMDGHIAPVDDPIWQKWSPPSGHNCRCSRLSLTEAQAQRRGLGKPAPGVEPDTGWEGDPTEGNEDLVRVIRERQQRCQTTFAPKRAKARGLWCDEGAARDALKAAGRALEDNGAMRSPLRAAWRGDEAQALIVASESAVKQHPRYSPAKAGDAASAWALVSDVLASADANGLKAAASGATVVLPVHAAETGGINRIPMAMAAWVGRLTGIDVASGVVQANRVGHTGASGWHRMAAQALFDGPIEPGARYLLVDDFLGQGGTFANLRGYVLARGAQVVGMVALTGKPRSAKIALQPQTLTELRRKHGNIEPWWAVEFGFGFDGLTQSEAEYLLRVDADTIRSRIAEARQRAGA